VIALDEPIEIQQIRIRNYSKTPSRGVKDISIYLDHVLLYQGILSASDGKASENVIQFHQHGRGGGFSSPRARRSDQDILMVDEGKVRHYARKDPTESSAVTDLDKRPTTGKA